MKHSKLLVTDVASLRATEYSADGQSVTISLTTKYTSERLYSVPLRCLSELINDLERLKTTMPVATGSTSDADTTPAAIASGQPPQRPDDAKAIKITVPKKWMLASGLPKHPLVILLFDPQTPTQAGYGIGGTAAREMATGLVKYADQIAEQSGKRSKKSP